MLAIRLAGWAHRNHKVQIVGTAISTTHNNGKWSLDGFTKKEVGDFSIPCAVPLTTNTPSGAPPYQANMVSRLSSVINQSKVYPDAVTTYRQILAANDAVEICTMGFLWNLMELLQSPADGISPLTGVELVAAKCPMLWACGGTFPAGASNNTNRDTNARTSAAYVAANWPGPITWCGIEVGGPIITGGNLQGKQAWDVLAQAMLDMGAATGRNSWDPTGLMGAISGDPALWGMTTVQGRATITNGQVSWVNDPAGPHRYVVKTGAMSDADYATVMNTLIVRTNWETYDPFPGVGP